MSLSRRILLPVFLGLAVTLALPAAPAAEAGGADSADSPDALFEEALASYRAAKYRKALDLVGKIQEENPGRIRFGDENLHNFKGSCLTALRYFQHARKEFERALATQPESFDMKYNLAEMDFLQEHFESARDKFADLLQSTSRGRLYSEFLEFKIGMCLLMEGDTDRVLERLSTHGRHTPIRIFLDTALAFHDEQADTAAVLLELAREKVRPGDYALYEDSLIECGLLNPPRLKSAERRELDEAMRRPLSLGTYAVLPETTSEPVTEPVLNPPAAATPSENS